MKHADEPKAAAQSPLSPEELNREQAADLPQRDAMSLVDPGAVMGSLRAAPPLPPDSPNPLPPERV